nr:glycosyltransferase [Enterobacter mori]
MRVGVVIVWYNPTEEQIKNVYNLSNIEFLRVCVADNSKEKAAEEAKELAKHSIDYVHNGNHGGIAGAFNRGIECLTHDDRIDIFFTMDQDSDIQPEYYKKMYEFMTTTGSEIACPDFFDRNAQTHGTFVDLTPYSYKVVKEGSTVFCISSGMGITKKAWTKIGNFDERLIIDHVDTDFCLKAYAENIKIHVNYEQCLNHAIGEREKNYLFGVCLKPNHHSYVRKYYIVRNGTYLAIKNFQHAKGYFTLNILRVVHEVACVVLYEKHKLKKLKYMALGLIHGIRGKLGALK